jgi:hypothetical protein
MRTPGRQIQGLSVSLDQPHLTDWRGSLLSDLQKQRRDVHSDHLAPRPDPLCELEKGLPRSASYIENNVSRPQIQRLDCS